MFHILLFTSIALIIFALLIAFSGRVSTVGYIAGILILFAILYVLGFFWLVLSLCILVLSAIFYYPAAERRMLRLLNMVIYSAIVLFGLSILALIAGRKIWK